jgi:hypothetical protein
MVVDRHRELLLGGLLADYVLVKEFFDFEGLRKLVRAARGCLGPVVFQDGVADRDAFITYIRPRIVARGRNQLPNDVLTLMAKRTPKSLIRSRTLHANLPLAVDRDSALPLETTFIITRTASVSNDPKVLGEDGTIVRCLEPQTEEAGRAPSLGPQLQTEVCVK